MTALDRIAAALEELVALEKAREQRKRAPRPAKERPRPSPEAKSKAAAIIRRMGVR